MKKLLSFIMLFSLSFQVLSSDVLNCSEKGELGYSFELNKNSEKGGLTHGTMDMFIEFDCEPMDCGEHCFHCHADEGRTSVQVSGDGTKAVFRAEYLVSPITLICQ